MATIKKYKNEPRNYEFFNGSLSVLKQSLMPFLLLMEMLNKNCNPGGKENKKQDINSVKAF